MIGPISDEARAHQWARTEESPFWDRDIDALRDEMRAECAEGGGDKERVAAVDAITAAGVPCRLYTPAGAAGDVFVWVHGGGWMLGDLDCFDSVCRAIANRVPCSVLSVEYRLAPEHVFPAAIDDVWSAVTWATDNFDAIAIGGDSAGGNLAAVAALRARDRNVELAHQVLIYPALDPAVDSDFAHRFRNDYRQFRAVSDLPGPSADFGAESQEGVRKVWECYIPDPSHRLEPDASPWNVASLAGLASATIITAEHDILRGEGETYANRLRQDGVAVQVINYAGELHGFFHLLGAFSAARDAVDQVAERLRDAFAAAAPVSTE